MSFEDLTEEQKDQYILIGRELEEERRTQQEQDFDQPQPEERKGVFTIFDKRVFDTKDTIKASNIDDKELQAVRILRNAANYMKTIAWLDVEKYLNARAETILASALSRKGFSIGALITNKKVFTTSHNKSGNKGFFSGGSFGNKEKENDGGIN